MLRRVAAGIMMEVHACAVPSTYSGIDTGTVARSLYVRFVPLVEVRQASEAVGWAINYCWVAEQVRSPLPIHLHNIFYNHISIGRIIAPKEASCVGGVFSARFAYQGAG
jgi:hypothetical protein